MPTLLHKLAAATGGNSGLLAGNHGPATAGRSALLPPTRHLETSGLGGAARSNGPWQLAKPAVAGPQTRHDCDRPQGAPQWHQ